MTLRRTLSRLAAVVFSGALAAGLAVAPAQAAPTGEQSLAAVLTADGNGTFDQNWYDYDIVTQAVLAVVAAKPASNVGLLTDGTVALTAFIPNDRAF
ncbi:MAG: fasciclin domain-containing protein, partial [Actinobacteria bacterium]|nr:fasciclin domain-containing protein [Actinomycetota bacterium]